MVLDSAKPEKRETQGKGPDTREYELYDLNNDMGNKDTWTGDPYLTEVYENEWGSSANLYIANHDNKEKLRGRLKVKNKEDNVSFWQKSVGFDIVKSIKELNGETIEDDINVFTVSMKELREYINGLKEISITVTNHTADINGQPANWNTLTITEIGG
jgi:hypothetical protein